MQNSYWSPFVARALALLSGGVAVLAETKAPPAAADAGIPMSQIPSPDAGPREQLKAQDAEHALMRLNEAIPRPGTWRRISVEFSPDPPDTNAIPASLLRSNVAYGWPTVTNIVFKWLSPDGRTFVRKEIASLHSNGRAQTKIYLRDQEGYWAVLKGAAILFPETAASRRTNAVSSSAPGQPSIELGVARSSYDAITGERIREGDRALLRIIQSLSEPEFREFVREAKRELPFVLRPLIKTSFIEKGIAQIAPFRVETMLDEQTGDLIVRRRYNKGGKLLDEEQGWVLVEDLPPEAYAVPTGFRYLRPKTLNEAYRLENKMRKDEAKAAEKTAIKH